MIKSASFYAEHQFRYEATYPTCKCINVFLYSPFFSRFFFCRTWRTFSSAVSARRPSACRPSRTPFSPSRNASTSPRILREFPFFPQSTYICRVQSCALRLPKYWPPTPLSTQRMCPPPAPKVGGTHSPGSEGGGGLIFWKTSDIGLATYCMISLRLFPMTY